MKFPLLISTPAHVTYLTGVSTSPIERDFWLLLSDETAYFLTDARYGDILTEFKSRPRRCRLGQPIQPVEISATNPLSVALSALLAKTNAQNTLVPHLYLEAENLTVAETKALRKKLMGLAPALKLKPTVGILASLREVKQADEIEAVHRACTVIDACLKDIILLIRLGMTEHELAFKLEMWLREKGHETAFPPIIAVNENAAVPHYNTQAKGKKKITKNCIILIDAGAKVNNYCSDITRMVAVGTPSDEFARCYNELLTVQKQTIQQLGVCKKYSEVDLFCRTALEKASIEPHSHATGHGIGLEVHESPRISFNAPDGIKPGHIVTIEPGTYVEGKFGIRIEDTVYINSQGQPKIFTKSPKALRIINF